MPDVIMIAIGFVVFILLLALFASLLITFFGVRFSRKQQELLLNAVVNLLPNTGCASCTNGSCQAFAEALLLREVSVDDCPCCSPEIKEQIHELVAQANPEPQELPKNLRKRKKIFRLRNDIE